MAQTDVVVGKRLITTPLEVTEYKLIESDTLDHLLQTVHDLPVRTYDSILIYVRQNYMFRMWSI